MVLIAGLVTPLACVPPSEDVEQGPPAPIVAGVATTTDPSIVEVFIISNGSVAKCTATLVTARVLVTAAHCIRGRTTARYGVFPGNDDGNVTGKDLLATSAATFDPLYGKGGDGHDLGVVVLAAPLSLPLVPLNRVPLESAVGKRARYIGYGLTNGINQTGDGIKRQAMAPIAQVTSELILIGKNANGTCNGDSGGPLLMDTGDGREALIGTVSFGDDATCRGNNFFQRIDTQVAWIDAQIEKYDPGAKLPDAGVGRGTGAADADVADAAAAPPDMGLADAVMPESADATVMTLPARQDASSSRPRPDASGAADAASPKSVQPRQQVHPKASGGCAVAPGARARGGPAWAALLLALLASARPRRSTRRGQGRAQCQRLAKPTRMTQP
jgi:secreted trypsin-like serine protease